MTLSSLRGLLAAALLVSASLACAQTTQTIAPAAAQRPDPADPGADVPVAVHRSAFTSYRAAGEVEVGSWREANDTVARIGGWRAYAREAAQPDGSAGPDPAAPSRPATDPAMRPVPAPAAAPAAGHGGHRGHGMH